MYIKFLIKWTRNEEFLCDLQPTYYIVLTYTFNFALLLLKLKDVSILLQLFQMIKAHCQLSQYEKKFVSRLTAKNLMYVRQILFVLSHLIAVLGGESLNIQWTFAVWLGFICWLKSFPLVWWLLLQSFIKIFYKLCRIYIQ